MIPGIKIDLNGREFVTPPASLGSVKRFLKAQAELVPGTAEYLDSMIAFVQETIARNYPDFTHDEAEDLLDGRNIQEVVEAIQESSAMTKGKATGSPSTGT